MDNVYEDGCRMTRSAKERGYWQTMELAEKAGVSDAWIRRQLLDGKLRGDKAGQVWTIPYDEGKRWLDSRKK
jgi:hypothetical protein